jgi:hypothetical protein
LIVKITVCKTIKLINPKIDKMKKILIPAACFIYFLLSTAYSHAQSIATPTAKTVNDENALKPTTEIAKTVTLKEEPKPPVIPTALQKTEVASAKTASTTDLPPDITKGAKAVEIKAGTQKGQQPQNIDRPKTSTIDPAKKTDAVTKPTPRIAPAIGGK